MSFPELKKLSWLYKLYFILCLCSSGIASDQSENDADIQHCRKGQFECLKTRQCIPVSWLCDGDVDCTVNGQSDDSDEDASICHGDQTCPRNYFRCNDGITCKRISRLCDDNHDCPDFSDEGPFCQNRGMCNDSGCRYGCKPSPKGPLCFCGEGKEPNGTDCAEINECNHDGICEQICTKKPVSYHCSCVPGYKSKGRKCIGINVPFQDPPTLIFSNSANIQHIFMNGTLVGSNTVSKVKEKTAMDFDHRNKSICWVKVNITQAGIQCAQASNFKEKWNFLLPELYTLSNINQVAFDWVAKNWYFLDDEREMMFACNYTLTVCVTLIDVSLSNPKDIALDPTKGLMFFTLWGNTSPVLERARMDGSDRVKLVLDKIVYPNGISIDLPSQKVYWVDTYLGMIERINYDGSNRKTIIRNTQVKNLYGISVFEDYLYVTSLDGNNILAVHKYNQTNLSSIKSNMTHPYSIEVYHRQKQPEVRHPCSVENGHCEHICIPLYKGASPIAKCRCKSGYKLLTRDKKCVAAKQGHFLLYGRGRPGAIKGISMEASGKTEDVMVPVLGLNRPTAIDYDARSQYIYYSDVQRFVIERQKIDGTEREVFLDKGLNNCEGLAVDWMGRNLYWTDEGLSSIYVASLNDSSIKKRLAHGNMSHPRAIVVDPKRGLMYWSDWSTEPHPTTENQLGGKIERAHMDGEGREVFIKDHLQWPNGLSLDYSEKRLYWCDAYLHRIERISLDGSGRETLFEGESLGHPYGLAHYENYIFWTEFQQGLVQRLNLPNKTITTLLKENPHLFEIRVFDAASQGGVNSCTENNNCEELCLSTPDGAKCSCRDGSVLANDRMSCQGADNYTEPSRCRDEEFECVKNLRCIDERYLCDGDNDCGDGSDEDSSKGGKCEKFTCRMDQFQCDNNRCISIHWVCDGEKDCVDVSDEEPNIKCRNATCSSNKFTCKESGRCIPHSWTCDSDLDCGDGDTSDEHADCVYPECELVEFRCNNQRCVPLEYICDGDDDCRDGSDERSCELPCSGPNKYSCDNNIRCLNKNVKCNGIKDCDDGTDEENCEAQTTKSLCHKNEFNCRDGMCIPEAWKCDKKWDCIDRSDEMNCGKVTCSPDEFLCAYQSQCIPKSFLCDGHMDCEDNSDEKDCEEKSPACIFPNHSCDNGTRCMNVTLFCDGNHDCNDGSDEGGMCDMSYECTLSSCKYLCQRTPEGHLCYCPPDLVRTLDGYSCTAIPLCEQWGICSQGCTSTKNKHKCYCEPGYEMEPDHYTCKSPIVPHLIFSNRHELRSVHLRTMSVKALISGLQNTVALDFYHSPNGDMIFWTDVEEDKIYRGSLVSGSLTNIEVVVQTGLRTAEGLAVDWIGENLYWVESNLDQIEVAKLNGSFRRTLIASNMENPRAIAVDSRFGMLFWTDWDPSLPRIERASMSGEYRQVIFHVDTKYGGWPNGLALDYVAKRIYWIDAKSDSIHTVTYDGEDLRNVLHEHESLSHPFSVALFENFVYWTDWKTNSVFRANKWNGTNVQVVQRAITQPFDIQVYHPDKQPRDNVTNPCGISNGGCSHLCLLSYNSTRSCHCPHIMSLAADKKTCYTNERVLLFSRRNEIRGVDLNMPYYHIIPPISLPKVVKVDQIDFVASEHRIYWADTELGEVQRTNLIGSSIETLIDHVLESPSGFAVDWVSRNLFVTSVSENHQSIMASNLEGEFLTDIITEGLDIPNSLAVHPFEGLLFWSDHSKSGQYIAMAKMDGTSRIVLTSEKENKKLFTPISLSLDFESEPNTLYWMNRGSYVVQKMDLEKHEVFDVMIAPKYMQEPYALTVYHDQLIFATHGDACIHSVNKNSGENHTVLRNNTEGVYALRVYDAALQNADNNTCSVNKGNCSHLCFPTSRTTRTCKCVVGYYVDPVDETKCIGSSEFFLYSFNSEIKAIRLDKNATNKKVIAHISRMSLASSLDYYEDYIYWSDHDAGTITRIKRDLTGRKTIIQNLDSIEDIAVDWIAGNIYWIDSSFGAIEVAHLNGSSRYVVVSGNMSKPKGIVTHPYKGFLFWSDMSPPKIERSALDGSKRQDFVNSSLQIVQDMVLDFQEDKLYWCDIRAHNIERISIDGSGREVILNGDVLKNPVAVMIYHDSIFWADIQKGKSVICKAKKSEPEALEVLESDLGDSLKDMLLYHEREKAESNPCAKDNGGCGSNLCLFQGGNEYKCACSHGKLSEDGHSCEPYDAFLMFSRVSKIDSIHMFDENNPNAPYPSIINKIQMRNVIGLSYDYAGQKIFFSDIQRGTINSVPFNGSDYTAIVGKQGSVEGLAYDPIHRELYWTSHSESSISRISMSVEGAKPEVIINLGPDDKPRGIDVDSCASRIYWTNWNTKHPSIQRAYLSGYDLQAIVTTEIRMPNALSLDHKSQKLYWSDARLDKIERCNLDGSDRYVLLSEHPQHPFDLAVYGDFVFWTDWVSHSVMRANKYTGGDVVTLRKNIARPMGIVAIANDTLCTMNPCYESKGGCEDICNVAVDSRVECSCHLGRILAMDGIHCTVKQANCSKEEFECTNGICIPYELTCDGVSACQDGSDENEMFCKNRHCIAGFFHCSNNRCIPESRVCDGQNSCGDYSDEMNCTCGEEQFRCHHGPCISKTYRCDHDPDCPDVSDEMDCDPPDCTLHPLYWDPVQKMINCKHTTSCIHPSWICDGQNDCWDMSDEKDCPAEVSQTSCPTNSFQCEGTKLCIPKTWKCDRDDDCNDGENGTSSSDERECQYGCRPDQFKCNNQDCIPGIWRCDGHADCLDRSDETEHCSTRQCDSSEFRCNNTGQCIPRSWVCDGENDCGDKEASDEHPKQGCVENICKPNEFQCLNLVCIVKSFYCDGDNDCGDSSDEPSVCPNRKCRGDEFECDNNRCIAKNLVCNNDDNCGDNSDEDDEICLRNGTDGTCPMSHQFKCENGNCVDTSVLCDGENNCGDFSDENKCNINECESDYTCPHICTDLPVGYECSCYSGYKPSEDGQICDDVDECKEDFPCSQICRNTLGSYKCSCDAGYLSLDGGVTCKANTTEKPTLIFSNRYFIRKIDLHGHHTELLAHNLTNSVALDFDWKEMCLYWSDVTALGSSIKRMCLGYPSHQLLHAGSVQSPDGLAVDWIGRNLYWCDKGKDTIEVSTLDGRFRKVLIRDGLQEPRAIVLDPFQGYMYWTDWGERPYIGKAGMDGTRFVKLINESLGWPNALTIDYITREIFWADAKQDYIAFADLDGMNRRTVIVRGRPFDAIHHIFALTVFEDQLYWTDWVTKSIERCHKYHCENYTTIAMTTHRPMDIQVFHPYRQMPLKRPNPCNETLGCKTLCLLTPDGGAVCSCPENYVLKDDGVSCESNCTSSQFVCSSTFKCIPSWWFCDTQDDCGDNFDEPAFCPPFGCSPGQFQCENKKCIQPNQLCDGITQCGDKSDEKDCDKHTCLLSQFKCPRNGTVQAHCISAAGRCDGTKDCLGGEDESDCLPKTCMTNQFLCANYKCIPQVWECDGDDDCQDNSDEPNTCVSRVCPPNFFRCNSGRCIPLTWKCDGDVDCREKEDEPDTCDDSSTCHPSYFKCQNNRCIPRRWQCDFDNDCGDNSDEENCAPRNCSEGDFRCDNGRCIRASWRCNGDFNCLDLSDEANCSVTCKSNEFLCISTNFCILSEWRCDGDTDCADGSDEENCDRTCQRGEFTCKNGQCISAVWQCDGENDCGDNSDEEHTLCSRLACPPGRFRCSNNVCIPQSKVCDGQDNCGDDSDENNRFCSMTNHCGEHEFQCANTHCISRAFVCDQMNDCDDNSDEVDCAYGPCHYGVCSQICLTKKSDTYTCACAPGYHLISGNGGACQAEGKEAVIFVASENELRQISAYKPSLQEINDVLLNPALNKSRIDSIDVLTKDTETYVFWTNFHTKSIYRYTIIQGKDEMMNGTRTKREIKSEVIITGLTEPRGIAVNWVDEQLYWVDAGMDTISIASLDGKYKKTLISTDLDQPHDIVVDPHEGFIYWTDWGGSAKIERATLDGSNRQVIITKDLYWPTGIAIDYPARRLYWTDPKASRIETVTMDGHNRQIVKIFQPAEEKPFKIDVFEDFLYITTFPNNAIIRMNKFGQGNLTHLIRGLNKASDIVLVQENKQTYNLTTPCQSPDSNLCGRDSLCVARNRTSASCLCPDEMVETKTSDQRTACTIVVPTPTSATTCGIKCYNGGSCLWDQNDQQYCKCKPEFEGHQCEIFRCVNYCKNKGFCFAHSSKNSANNAKPTLKCNCPPQWTGKQCETPSYRCEDFCYNGGTCRFQQGIRQCTCPDGFLGDRCEKCADLKCLNDGICHMLSPEDRSCACLTGYHGSKCEQSDCDGYCRVGNCTINNGKPNCHCPPTYSGKHCEQDQCEVLCLNGGTCIRGAKRLSCDCPSGFQGRRCEQDRCGCLNGATCVSTKTEMGMDYVCHCAPKYAGTHCDKYMPTSCQDMPCKNGGTCDENKGMPMCRCFPQWTGQFCETESESWNACSSYCLHGGVCSIPQRNSYSPLCICPKGTAGRRCEISTSCSNYCFNYGTCVPPLKKNDEKATCVCPDGFIGQRCEKSIALAYPKAKGSSDFSSGVGPIAISICVFILVAAASFVAFIYCRKKRGQAFMHVRMQDPANVEINNPMYMKDDFEASEALSSSYAQEPDKMTNFTNPVYDSLYPLGSASGEEKAGLLHNENLQVEYRESQGTGGAAAAAGPSQQIHPLA